VFRCLYIKDKKAILWGVFGHQKPNPVSQTGFKREKPLMSAVEKWSSVPVWTVFWCGFGQAFAGLSWRWFAGRVPRPWP
jgi:hypothetical protein